MTAAGRRLDTLIEAFVEDYPMKLPPVVSPEEWNDAWTLLDVTPFGRQETWEDSPEPQTAPYEWWRRHDEYGTR